MNATSYFEGLARTVYIHRIWPYIWWFPWQKYRIYTVYIWFWPTLFMCEVLCCLRGDRVSCADWGGKVSCANYCVQLWCWFIFEVLCCLRGDRVSCANWGGKVSCANYCVQLRCWFIFEVLCCLRGGKVSCLHAACMQNSNLSLMVHELSFKAMRPPPN